MAILKEKIDIIPDATPLILKNHEILLLHQN